jgi:curved DNA-binding protein CbpA
MEEQRAHDVLGLSPGASMEEIQREYRRLVMSWHPDHLGRAAPDIRAQATAYLKELNVAYGLLTSPTLRRFHAGRQGPAHAGSARARGNQWRPSDAAPLATSSCIFFIVLALVLLRVALRTSPTSRANAA